MKFIIYSYKWHHVCRHQTPFSVLLKWVSGYGFLKATGGACMFRVVIRFSFSPSRSTLFVLTGFSTFFFMNLTARDVFLLFRASFFRSFACRIQSVQNTNVFKSIQTVLRTKASTQCTYIKLSSILSIHILFSFIRNVTTERCDYSRDERKDENCSFFLEHKRCSCSVCAPVCCCKYVYLWRSFLVNVYDARHICTNQHSCTHGYFSAFFFSLSLFHSKNTYYTFCIYISV